MAERRDPRRDEDEEQGAAAESATAGGSRVINILLVVLLSVLLSAGSAIGALYLVGAGPFAAPAENSEKDSKAQPGDKLDKNQKDKKDKNSAEEVKSMTASYVALDPPFVVNLENPTEARFLQVSVEVMTRDAQVAEDVKKHMSAIRHSLVLLFSSQSYTTLASAEGKEKIRAEVLAAIQKILMEYTGKPGVEAVYFTDFVMQ